MLVPPVLLAMLGHKRISGLVVALVGGWFVWQGI